jgi:hypothetical protein
MSNDTNHTEALFNGATNETKSNRQYFVDKFQNEIEDKTKELNVIKEAVDFLQSFCDLAPEEIVESTKFYISCSTGKYLFIRCETRKEFDIIRRLCNSILHNTSSWKRSFDAYDKVFKYILSKQDSLHVEIIVSELPPSCSLITTTSVEPATPERTVTRTEVICNHGGNVENE